MRAHRRPSWYLHPLVAQQKHDAHVRWAIRWQKQAPPGLLLKTDLFEDAYGSDTLLPELCASARGVIAIDCFPEVVQRAGARFPGLFRPIVADCAALPLDAGSVTWVYSPSTLDHSASPADLTRAVQEISRVLPAGGLLLITLDNPRNPLYWALRMMSRFGFTPFPMGFTPSASAFARTLDAAGFDVLGSEFLIHNPRVISTAVFVALERAFGRRADRAVALLLACFARLGRLPTRTISACFVATAARKRHPSSLVMP
jgi:SAM-dependent methyltransferase